MKVTTYDPNMSDGERFSDAVTRLLTVPHSAIKARLDAEKKKKRRKKRAKTSASRGVGRV
jgi:hypothetical protein